MTQLVSNADRERARALVEAQGLTFDVAFDDLVGAFDGGELVAAGARHRDILKMIAIAPPHQGGEILGAIVTELVRLGSTAGHDALFVFTKPEHAASFEALNFALLATHGRAALLEYGGGLARWLAANRPLVHDGPNGAIVANCNPFTIGHRHLVEVAARQVEMLYVFVVREDRSAFPFDVRFRLVREGTKDLANVRVLDTSRYAVSALTFPAYFLKQGDAVADIQMELDLQVFARHVAPFFHVRRRFFGTEPTCATTRAYNVAMQRVLPPFGIEPVEIERVEGRGEPISASRVRAALRAGELAGIEALVPASTLSFLQSQGARPIRERLLIAEGRHE